MITYKEVAEHMKLDGITKVRFIKYMTTRWENEEKLQCETGYATEWAERFKGGCEYSASDYFGQGILNEMDGKK